MKEIIAQLFKDTGIRVIKANQLASTPPLPYGVYNITSPFIKDRARPNEFAANDKKIFEQQYQQTVSFNIYGNTTEEALQKTNDIHRWFLFMGREFIHDQNIAVVEITNIEDRTTFLVDSYDYKYGFDVRFRFEERIETSIDWIEKINIQ
ncbi:hypothetical protein MXL46_08215 [Heyndrickxia sporothermodurans]|uniref:phage neck terminator protein n=1 Tax=Heyndrickxia sporothermodurans TaxID=46224 RepID=UPI002DBEF756|nr:hypothetical protein [Heyndrickxia sporothermodurans]MEB6549079.1 hypothetical protein [Heyndrickxia sporothermodurans]